MKKLLPVLFGIVFQSCNLEPENQIESYFDLDSLLANEIVELKESNATLIKYLNLGTESADTLHMDSVSWTSELLILGDFNPNQAAYINTFETESTNNGQIILSPKVGEAPDLTTFAYSITGTQPTQVSGEIKKASQLYQMIQRMNMRWEDGRLINYEIRGGQKLLSQDSTHYSIRGEIYYP